MEHRPDEERKDDSQAQSDAPKADSVASRGWGQQIVGGILGGFIAYIALGIAGQLGWQTPNLGRTVLWGAVLGSLLGSGSVLVNAGARLTRRKEPVWLNVLVALAGMAVFFGLIVGLTYLGLWVFRSLF